MLQRINRRRILEFFFFSSFFFSLFWRSEKSKIQICRACFNLNDNHAFERLWFTDLILYLKQVKIRFPSLSSPCCHLTGYASSRVLMKLRKVRDVMWLHTWLNPQSRSRKLADAKDQDEDFYSIFSILLNNLNLSNNFASQKIFSHIFF